MSKILVAGIGNRYYRDDGFGSKVIESLRVINLPGDVEVRDVGLCGSTLAPELDEYELLIFVDTVKKGGRSGTVYRTEIKAEQVKELKLEDTIRLSTPNIHNTGLEELLSFAKTIGTLPPTTIVIGCEASKLEPGDTLTPAVEAAVPVAIELIMEELQRYREWK